MSNSSETFRLMADRIEHNVGSTFGGAAVIIPPGDSEPIELLILDSKADSAQFWGTLKARLQLALEEIERRQQQFGMMVR